MQCVQRVSITGGLAEFTKLRIPGVRGDIAAKVKKVEMSAYGAPVVFSNVGMPPISGVFTIQRGGVAVKQYSDQEAVVRGIFTSFPDVVQNAGGSFVGMLTMTNILIKDYYIDDRDYFFAVEVDSVVTIEMDLVIDYDLVRIDDVEFTMQNL